MPPPPVTHEAPPRPKVMRRPAQFSRARPAQPAAELVPQPQEPAPAALPAAAKPRAWQEDGRFGLILITTLAIVNLLLVQLLSFLPAATSRNENTTGTILFGVSAMPQAVKQDTSDITVYADPRAEGRLATEFDLNRLDPTQNELSVSPKDIPAPRARALDKGGQ